MLHLGNQPPASAIPFGAEPSLLPAVCRDLRYQVVQMSHQAGTPHLGSALSVIDILAAIYWRAARIDPANARDPARDRVILSKGHAATALYAALAARGFFPEAWLDRFAQPGSPLAEQPAPGCAPGVELATGSLGHGLPVGAGMALAAAIRGGPQRVFVVLSDGECNEGSVWEAALFASANALGRLVAVIDYNKWQATGRSDEVMGLPSLAAKWAAFGWEAREVDGHSLADLAGALTAQRQDRGRPLALVAHTTKGRGVSFMEDDNNWHYRVPKAEEVAAAARELAAP
ncbi:MAG TPA: transketolase [Opitutaceae bacterium]